jgi:hypothetical protein
MKRVGKKRFGDGRKNACRISQLDDGCLSGFGPMALGHFSTEINMKLTIAIIFASLSTTVAYAETYNYSCKACVFPGISSGDGCDVVDGKTFPLRVDDKRNVLEWRGKKYSLTEQPNCANFGWHADGNGRSFDFCTATQGYGAIEDKGDLKVQCDLKR